MAHAQPGIITRHAIQIALCVRAHANGPVVGILYNSPTLLTKGAPPRVLRPHCPRGACAPFPLYWPKSLLTNN